MDNNESNLFTWEQQRQFAQVSGDYNPIHTDDIASRRTLWGKVLLYGMHMTLWALDGLASRNLLQHPFSSFKVRFLKPVFVGETVSGKVTQDGDLVSSVQLFAGGMPVATIMINRGKFQLFAEEDWQSVPPPPEEVDIQEPADLRLEDMPGKSGRVMLRAGAAAMFPSLAAVLGARQVQALATISRLVGMICPGLYSMSYSYRIGFPPNAAEADFLDFQVEDADDRFRMLTQRVRGGGIEGTVVAMVRVPPVRQPGMTEVAKQVKKGEFDGVRAIVIGGSRGLGEVTSRIVAAGGGNVLLTYSAGADDAFAVRDEIRASGGICEAMRYVACEPASSPAAWKTSEFNQVYYYATGPMRKRTDDIFSPVVFQEFCQLYVDGFHKLCAELTVTPGQVVKVMYPCLSSAGSGPGVLAEYAMARAAGECLCHHLNQLRPELRITVERLPWILTDQTSGMQDVEYADAIDILLPLVRRMSARQRN